MPPLTPEQSQSEESQSSTASHIPPNSQLASLDPSQLQVAVYGAEPSTPAPDLPITADQQLAEMKAALEAKAQIAEMTAKAQIAEMTAALQRRFNAKAQNINNSTSSKAGRRAAPKPPPKKTAPKTTPTTITTRTTKTTPPPKAAPAPKKGSGPASATRSLITHEASRGQFLVRITGAPSKTFAYGGNKRSMKQARLEAEQFLAKASKLMK